MKCVDTQSKRGLLRTASASTNLEHSGKLCPDFCDKSVKDDVS